MNSGEGVHSLEVFWSFLHHMLIARLLLSCQERTDERFWLSEATFTEFFDNYDSLLGGLGFFFLLCFDFLFVCLLLIGSQMQSSRH